jgi:hypothetical protein
MENTRKMNLAVMSTELSVSEMEMIQAGSGRGFGCYWAIGCSVLAFGGMCASGATVVGAGLGIAGFYTSIIGVALSC